MYVFWLKGSIAFRFHAGQEKRHSKGGGIVNFSHWKPVWFCSKNEAQSWLSWRLARQVLPFAGDLVLSVFRCPPWKVAFDFVKTGIARLGQTVFWLILGMKSKVLSSPATDCFFYCFKAMWATHVFIIRWYIWNYSSPLVWIRGDFMSSVSNSWLLVGKISVKTE